MSTFDDLMKGFRPTEPCREKLTGKYRGKVVNNIDPLGIGRIQATVPGVMHAPLTWILPCVPGGGLQAGSLSLPPIGAAVWVEFEQGDIRHPIWSGCFWETAAETPRASFAASPVMPNIVHQTVGQNSVTVFGAPGGGVTICAGPIESPASPRIVLSAAGIILTDGKGGMISLTGGVVTVNMGALVIK